MGRVVLNYLFTAMYVLLSFTAAAVLAWIARRKLPRLSNEVVLAAANLCGTGFLLVAGIGRLGWSIQTYDGTTPPEVLDARIFWSLSVLGTVLLVYEFAARKFRTK